MPEVVEQTRTTTTTKWWSGMLNIQTVIYICAAFVWAVIFFKDSQSNWEEVKRLRAEVDKMKSEKADVSDLKSLGERVTRQYETSNKISERVTEVEKEAAYQKGVHEGGNQK